MTTLWKLGGKRTKFWKLARKIAELKASGTPMEGLIIDGQTITDKDKVNKHTNTYLKTLFANKPNPSTGFV